MIASIQCFDVALKSLALGLRCHPHRYGLTHPAVARQPLYCPHECPNLRERVTLDCVERVPVSDQDG